MHQKHLLWIISLFSWNNNQRDGLKMKLMFCIDPELLFTDCDDDDDDDDLQSAGLNTQQHLDTCNLNNPPSYEHFVIELIRSDQNRSDLIVRRSSASCGLQ